MLWPSELLVDGVSVPLAGVLADCTVRHGRDDVAADPQASTIQLTLLGLTHAQTAAFRINAAVVLNCRDGDGPVLPRFTGRVTDATLDDDRLTLIAVGRLATLGRYTIGETAWPEEPWSARLLRIFTEAGFTVPVNLVPNPGFESGLTGWTTNSPVALALSTSVKHSGAQSCVFTSTAVDQFMYSTPATTLPHTSYTASGWVLMPAGGDVVFQMTDFSDLGYGGVVHVPANVWTRISVSGVTDAHTVQYCFVQAKTVGEHYLDDFSITLTYTDLDLQPDPTFDPVLVGRDPATAGTTTLADYLAFLAPMVGAAVCDLPDGRVMVQALGARTLTSPTVLDPAIVAYVPAWYQDLPHGNVITVRYTGDQSEQVTVSDSGSIAAYGAEFPATIDTTFKNASDATTRANERLARSAYSHWNMPQAPLIEPRILSIGVPVWVSMFPDASPYDPWTPILEGWTDQITGDEWTMELALSDPLASGITPLPWDDVDPSYHWNTINQTVAWKDALTPASIVP